MEVAVEALEGAVVVEVRLGLEVVLIMLMMTIEGAQVEDALVDVELVVVVVTMAAAQRREGGTEGRVPPLL